MTAPRRFVLADGVLAQAALDEAVLLDARAGRYFSANDSASRLLRALLDGLDEAQALALLLDHFDVDAAQLQADIARCLEDWLARGLIVERR